MAKLVRSKKILISLIVIVSSFSIGFSTKAQEIEIFSEDFEGEIENWNLESGWDVTKENGNHVLQGTKHTFVKAYLEGDVVTFEAKIKILEGTLHIGFRTNEMPDGQTRYFLGLGKDSGYLQKEIKMNFQELARGGREGFLGNWHRVKIEIEDKKIRVFIDENPLFEVEDKDLIEKGSISFETLENSIAYIDDVRAEIMVPETKEIKAGNLFLKGEHRGDIALTGREILVLESEKFLQFGNIYLEDEAKLIIKNAELRISRYQKLLNHWGFVLRDRATLEIENSKIIPEGREGPTLVVVEARDRARVKMVNSPTQIHLFIVDGSSKALVEKSEIIGEIGGLIIAGDSGEVKIVDSKIGAVNLNIPPGATFEASGLGTGFFKDWDLQRDTKVSGINYNVILQNTELVPDRLGPGPYERSFPVFIDSSAKVKIKDSQLRKVVITLHDEKAEFSNFVVEKLTSFHYRDIHLENVKVMGQWGIFPHGSSDVIVRDSEEFWTFIYDDSKLTLINTHLDEFDPRDFQGKMIFENSRWDTAAEIVGGEGLFMGGGNDFSMEGSLDIGYIGGFSWQDSKVTRTYEVVGKPGAKLTLTKSGQTVWSGVADERGGASFSIKFDDNTFNDSWLARDNFGNKKEVTFFSKTPIDMEERFISEFIREMKRKGPPSSFLKLLTPVILFIVFLVILGKILRRRGNGQRVLENKKTPFN